VAVTREDLEGLCGIHLQGRYIRLWPLGEDRRGTKAWGVRKERGGAKLQLYLFRVHVQDGTLQALCPKDALEPSLQLLEKVLPL
jgi:hypothetical protein